MNKKRIVQFCCAALVASGIGLNIQNAIADYGIAENSLSLVAGPGSNSGSNSNSNSNSNWDSNYDPWGNTNAPWKMYRCVEHHWREKCVEHYRTNYFEGMEIPNTWFNVTYLYDDDGLNIKYVEYDEDYYKFWVWEECSMDNFPDYYESDCKGKCRTNRWIN